MKEINFISCGLLGDFFHCLSVVKHICQRDNAKANIYLSGNVGKYSGDYWRFSVEKAHEDLINIVSAQPYVNKFEVVPDNFNQPFINLNSWRHFKNLYYITWSDLLSNCYSFGMSNPYKWITIDKIDSEIKDKIVIHHSTKRYNTSFDWNSVFSNANEEFVFVTYSMDEWDQFPFKNDRLKLKLVSTLEEMSVAINSCKLFIGNQSAPLALASALDVNRIAELFHAESQFYMGENKYSENISWFLNNDQKYFSNKSLIKL